MLQIKKPLEAHVVEILRLLQEAGTSFFLVGAMARQILLSHVFGLPEGRATVDLDIAIAVENWQAYQHIKARLLTTSGRLSAGKEPHRLRYRVPLDSTIYDQPYFDCPVDIIPFQGVEDEARQIRWPPDAAIHMSVSGYSEASTATVSVAIDDALTIRVASLAAVAMLKILAWHDRWNETKRDAQDLALILRGYETAGNNARPYEAGYASHLERYGWDTDIMWAWLLGQDIQSIISPGVMTELLSILSDAKAFDRLLRHASEYFPSDRSVEARFVALHAGLNEPLVKA